MIERFNFYDIYGYLLPGVLLLGLIWAPAGLITGSWPPTAWSSALFALAGAYILGHLLHALSSAAFPSLFRDKKNRKRMPSDLLFDKKEDQVLSQQLYDLKDPIAVQIQKDFGVDVEPNVTWRDELKGRRSSAFLKCRNVLIRQKIAAYAEQQQGMYALMRGCAASFALAFGLYVGVAVGSQYRSTCLFSDARLWFVISVIVALIASFVALAFQRRPSDDERKPRAIVFWAIAAALAFGGAIAADRLEAWNPNFQIPTQIQKTLSQERDPTKFLSGESALDQCLRRREIQRNVPILMIGAAAAALVLTPLCVAAYRVFAVNFAVTVYRDYYRAATTSAGGQAAIQNGRHGSTPD